MHSIPKREIHCPPARRPQPPLPTKRAAQAAFTLVEILVAILIQLVLFVSIFGALNYGVFVTRMSRENLRATQIMLDKMEGLRLYQWQQITNPSILVPAFTNWSYETTNIGQYSATGTGLHYTGLVSVVTPIPTMGTTYKSNMAQVTVTVGWASGGRTNNYHTRNMRTFFSQSGIENTIRVN